MDEYEERIVFFIDFLGFRSFIEKNDSLKKSLNILSYFNTSNIIDNLEHSYNPSIGQQSILNLKESQHELNTEKLNHEGLRMTHFSDSLVLSLPKYSRSGKFNKGLFIKVIHYLAHCILELWENHQMIIRGGVSSGALYHKNNGYLFGKALNHAYVLESKVAKNPTILFDKDLSNLIYNSIRPDDLLFYLLRKEKFNCSEKNCKSEDLYQMNLATVFNLYLKCNATLISSFREFEDVKNILLRSKEDIKKAITRFEGNDVIQGKYIFLQHQMESLFEC